MNEQPLKESRRLWRWHGGPEPLPNFTVSFKAWADIDDIDVGKVSTALLAIVVDGAQLGTVIIGRDDAGQRIAWPWIGFGQEDETTLQLVEEEQGGQSCRAIARYCRARLRGCSLESVPIAGLRLLFVAKLLQTSAIPRTDPLQDSNVSLRGQE